jgi:hypothetical protein
VKLVDDRCGPEAWAVVVDPSYHRSGNIPVITNLANTHDGFTRVLEDSRNCDRISGVSTNGGWWIDQKEYCYEIIPEEEIPEEIIVLAMRCLLDRSFVPFVSEDYKV